jgi:hypothetical protein
MFHRLAFLIPEEQLQKLLTQGEGEVWRNDLKEGDMVDALWHHLDKQNNSRGSGWSQAMITKVEGDCMRIEYTKEPSAEARVLERWSVEIAPFESKTKEIWEFKKTIETDMQVDV